ncbi:MAG: molybdopterin-synthase adenylyltransferase MoeB [Myxococcales bacterium]|nr:molybdopterin-synthase adenylyltransferase MoeB [Myxococcales bacterium]
MSHSSSLSPQEQLRYARQLILPEIGPVGQERLKQARVLVVGAGGLGSPALLYLAAAGVGHLTIIDPDQVDETNLQRQVLYDTEVCGSPKVEAAKARLHGLNPHLQIEIHQAPLDIQNARALVQRHDLTLEGSDNFVTKYLVNDACVLEKKPYLGASVRGFSGMLALYATPQGPCYRCLFPEMPDPSTIPTCAEAGVLGTVPGLFGTLQAHEALRFLLQLGDAAKTFLKIDMLQMRFQSLQLPKDPDCPVCGESPRITSLQQEHFFCATTPKEETTPSEELPWLEIDQVPQTTEGTLFIDVRTAAEYEAGHLPSALHRPLPLLLEQLDALQDTPHLVIYCQRGQRAIDAYNHSKAQHKTRVSLLRGGYEAWLKDQAKQA